MGIHEDYVETQIKKGETHREKVGTHKQKGETHFKIAKGNPKMPAFRMMRKAIKEAFAVANAFSKKAFKKA